MATTTTLTLPARYVHDWWQRCGDDMGVPEPTGKTWRSPVFKVTLTPEALADLVSDVKHYTSPVMRSDFMESCPDVVRSAEAARRRLEKAGLL